MSLVNTSTVDTEFLKPG